jgi:hypothetical protein
MTSAAAAAALDAAGEVTAVFESSDPALDVRSLLGVARMRPAIAARGSSSTPKPASASVTRAGDAGGGDDDDRALPYIARLEWALGRSDGTDMGTRSSSSRDATDSRE